MKIRELLHEGGWDTKITQGTVITRSVVKRAMVIVGRFINEWNLWLAKRNIAPVRIGTPTGSSAYYEVDDEDKIYGDIDLQIVVPSIAETQDKTHAQQQTIWYDLENAFVQEQRPSYVHDESHAGHPIMSVGKHDWVQIDLMIHTPDLEKWGAARTIPERGIKGLLHGNMFSVLGELLTMSIQHSGVQYKIRDGKKQPYASTRKNYDLKTITKDPETFVREIFDHECQELGIANAHVDPLLLKHPGKNLYDVKISNLVNAVKGLAQSFEKNNMYGQGDLARFTGARDFLDQFLELYTKKAMKDVDSTKRDKAEDPTAIARAEDDKRKVLSGLKYVTGLFNA